MRNLSGLAGFTLTSRSNCQRAVNQDAHKKDCTCCQCNKRNHIFPTSLMYF